MNTIKTCTENEEIILADQMVVSSIAQEARGMQDRLGPVGQMKLLDAIQKNAEIWADACAKGLTVYRGGSHVAVIKHQQRVLLITVA